MKKYFIQASALTLVILISVVIFKKNELSKIYLKESNQKDAILEKSKTETQSPENFKINSHESVYINRDKAAEIQNEELQKTPDKTQKYNKALTYLESLKEKVLKTDKEKELFNRITNDKEMIFYSFQQINSKNSQDVRMKWISFITEALTQNSDNFETKKLITNQIEELVTKQDISSVKDSKLRKSLAADQIELLSYLYRYDFERAKQFKTEITDEYKQKLFAFTESYYFNNFQKN